MQRLLLCLALLSLLAPTARAGDTPPSGTPPGYRIGAGDVLEITVLDNDDLSRTVTVLPDGRITYPYVGEFVAAGLTISEITRRFVAGLGAQLRRPQITVTVRERQARQVSILGAVKTPGKRSIQEGWRVLDLLADVGGLSVERPEWTTATLIRGGTRTLPLDMVRLMTGVDPEQNLPLEAGDVLLVQELDPSRTQVQVLGEVAKPGPVPVPKDGSVVAVLTSVGGPTPRAALSRAALLRGGRSLPLDLRGLLTDGRIDPAVTLQPGDTLVIPANKLWYAVFGAAQKPGYQDYPDTEKLTILSALSLSGGQTPDADLKNASLVRSAKDGKPTLVAVNLEDMLKKGDLSKDLPLHPGDILYLPTKRPGGGVRLTDILSFIPFVNFLVR